MLTCSLAYQPLLQLAETVINRKYMYMCVDMYIYIYIVESETILRLFTVEDCRIIFLNASFEFQFQTVVWCVGVTWMISTTILSMIGCKSCEQITSCEYLEYDTSSSFSLEFILEIAGVVVLLILLQLNFCILSPSFRNCYFVIISVIVPGKKNISSLIYEIVLRFLNFFIILIGYEA